MAAVTFNTFQKEQMRKQLKAALIAFRNLPHALASNWMRRAAAKAEHARRPPAPHLVMVKRLCLGALVTLIGGVVLAGMIALETAVYLQAVDF